MSCSAFPVSLASWANQGICFFIYISARSLVGPLGMQADV